MSGFVTIIVLRRANSYPLLQVSHLLPSNTSIQTNVLFALSLRMAIQETKIDPEHRGVFCLSLFLSSDELGCHLLATKRTSQPYISPIAHRVCNTTRQLRAGLRTLTVTDRLGTCRSCYQFLVTWESRFRWIYHLLREFSGSRTYNHVISQPSSSRGQYTVPNDHHIAYFALVFRSAHSSKGPLPADLFLSA
jgi:hypothetical protein